MQAAFVPSCGKQGTTKTTKGFTSFYTKGEEIFNAVSHIVGGAFGICALILGLVVAYPVASAMAAMAVFGVSIIILYTMSALYHFLPNGTAKGVFRIFDHCTIYLLIAGTYTPYCVIALGLSPLAIGILVAEWVLAVLGITANAIAMNHRAVKILSMGTYVGMGWAIVISFPTLLIAISHASFLLLLIGGIAYTGGIVFYAFGSKVKYFHAVWHLFDLAGTVLQFASILLLLL
jgi:hemolysin III